MGTCPGRFLLEHDLDLIQRVSDTARTYWRSTLIGASTGSSSKEGMVWVKLGDERRPIGNPADVDDRWLDLLGCVRLLFFSSPVLRRNS